MWLPPWVPVGREIARGLEEELSKELAPGHELFGLPAHAVARRQDTDDVLFLVNSSGGRYAVVHLTWTNRTETNTSWPAFDAYATLHDWVRDRMQVDHRDPDANR